MLPLAPAEFCAALLAALEASEGRRRSRKRDQTADAIGLAMKRHILERAVLDRPDAQAFEAWLMQEAANPMAASVMEEWRLASTLPEFAEWLARGAPSDDVQGAPR
jgi:hypothetical protein